MSRTTRNVCTTDCLRSKPLHSVKTQFRVNDGPMYGAVDSKYTWEPGQELLVSLPLTTSPEMTKMIWECLQDWMAAANIKFKLTLSKNAPIRVSFVQDGSSWSWVGKRCLDVPTSEATMNLGINERTDVKFFRSTVLHEFGHALGLVHEHQSPAALKRLLWDRSDPAKIYRYFREHWNWNRVMVDTQILRLAVDKDLDATAFDDESVMLYPFPAVLFKDGKGTRRNHRLSKRDKELIGKTYPFSRQSNASRANSTAPRGPSSDESNFWSTTTNTAGPNPIVAYTSRKANPPADDSSERHGPERRKAVSQTATAANRDQNLSGSGRHGPIEGRDSGSDRHGIAARDVIAKSEFIPQENRARSAGFARRSSRTEQKARIEPRVDTREPRRTQTKQARSRRDSSSDDDDSSSGESNPDLDDLKPPSRTRSSPTAPSQRNGQVKDNEARQAMTTQRYKPYTVDSRRVEPTLPRSTALAPKSQPRRTHDAEQDDIAATQYVYRPKASRHGSGNIQDKDYVPRSTQLDRYGSMGDAEGKKGHGSSAQPMMASYTQYDTPPSFSGGSR